MNAAFILILTLAPAVVSAQESALLNRREAFPPTVPEAVLKAPITAQTVLKGGGGAGGGDLVIQRIERPVFPPKASVSNPGIVPPSPEQLAARAARRALQPNLLLLFSPTVVIYEDGFSLVRWGSLDRLKGFQQYAAWVRMDLSAIHACPDLTVGRTRYCLLPMMFHATDRMSHQWKVPAASSFKAPTDIVLAEGDPRNTAALEPLLALLDQFDTDGATLEATSAAIKANHKARSAWEAANPAAPEDTVIRFWTEGD